VIGEGVRGCASQPAKTRLAAPAGGGYVRPVRRAATRATLIAGLASLSLASGAHAAAHPSPIASRAKVPLGTALWYACADPAYGGPAALDCPVRPAAAQTVASLAATYSSTIDGVGLETHLGAGGSYPTLAALESVMAKYAQLGLRVALTELDVLRPVTWDGGIAQRAAYDTAAQACREMPNCTAVTVWGVADAYSWRSADQRATLVDASLAVKPSYADVRYRLADPKPATGPWTPAPCGPTPPATGPAQTTGPTSGSSIASNQPPPADAALAPIAPLAPAPPATAPPPPRRARVDVAPPVVTIRASGSQRLDKALAVTVSCRDEACRAVIGATVRVGKARGARPRTYGLTTVRHSIAKGHAIRARLRFTAPAHAAIRRALRDDQRVIATLKITVSDAAGNTRVHRRSIALRR
jgi:hypothetical protein